MINKVIRKNLVNHITRTVKYVFVFKNISENENMSLKLMPMIKHISLSLVYV